MVQVADPPAAGENPGGRRSRRWPGPVAAVVGVLVVLGGVLVAARTRPASMPRLPVLGPATIAYDGDVGDPFVLTARGGVGPKGYVLFGTDDWPSHIPTATSPDLHTWTVGPDAIPIMPVWADADTKNSQTWAPAALALPQGYLLYVSVLEVASGRHCIAVAASAIPAGPYRDALGSPLVCQRSLGGDIDPSVTRDPAGNLHLLWKSDGNCCGLPASLWEQDLRPDGIHLEGSAHKLLTADRAWQAGIIENPALTPATGGGWWLFYSGNEFDSAGYATGLAFCPTIAGPCRETADHPFLSGTATQFSPGGLDFFRDPTGQLWASFATWSLPPRNGRFYCCRPLNIARVLHS